MSWKMMKIEDNGFSRKRFAATKTLSRYVDRKIFNGFSKHAAKSRTLN